MNDDAWMFLLSLACMCNVTPENLEERKREQERIKANISSCPYLKEEQDMNATISYCTRTGELCNGCSLVGGQLKPILPEVCEALNKEQRDINKFLEEYYNGNKEKIRREDDEC